MKDLRTRIHEELDKRGWTPTKLSEKSGVPQPTIQRFLSGTHGEPRSATIKKLAVGFGITEAELRGFSKSIQTVKIIPNLLESLTDKETHLKISEERPEYLPVKLGSFHLQAGITGFTIEYLEEEKPPLYFNKGWFKANGYKPNKLVACKIKGDSMEPRLFAGDVVIINTDDNAPKDGKVFAVNYEGELVIKRMIRDGGQWYLSSDNPDKTRHPNKICNADICIPIGRVVYRQSSEI